MDNFESDEQNFEGGGGEKSLPSPLLFSTSPPLPSPILRFYPSPPLPSPPSSFKASYAGYNYSLLLTFYSFIFFVPMQSGRYIFYFVLR